jgi:hypothetical protein
MQCLRLPLLSGGAPHKVVCQPERSRRSKLPLSAFDKLQQAFGLIFGQAAGDQAPMRR